MSNNTVYKGYTFVETCSACPEQYDVYDPQGNQVAYVRLRWGMLRVDAPDCGGKTIYSLAYSDDCLGSFPDDHERTKQMNIIADKIIEHTKNESNPCTD